MPDPGSSPSRTQDDAASLAPLTAGQVAFGGANRDQFKVGDLVRARRGSSRCVVLEVSYHDDLHHYLRLRMLDDPEDDRYGFTDPARFWEVYDPEFEQKAMPEIVVLCGSTRFKTEFERQTRRLGLEGKIVLSVSMFGHSGDLTPEQCTDGHPTKTALDDLHKRKIDLADRVLVINPGGYIGTSTASEIRYAEHWRKPVEYLVPFRVPCDDDCDAPLCNCQAGSRKGSSLSPEADHA